MLWETEAIEKFTKFIEKGHRPTTYLTLFSPMFHFYPPWKAQKICDFLAFPGGIMKFLFIYQPLTCRKFPSDSGQRCSDIFLTSTLKKRFRLFTFHLLYEIQINTQQHWHKCFLEFPCVLQLYNSFLVNVPYVYPTTENIKKPLVFCCSGGIKWNIAISRLAVTWYHMYFLSRSRTKSNNWHGNT